MTKKELAELINVDQKTLRNWEETKPELIKLINLGLRAKEQIVATEKLLNNLKEIEEKANSGKLELK